MLDLLINRRSIRKYKDILIEKDKIDKLIKAALLSPSSRGICPWEFVVVQNKETIEKLSIAKENGSGFLKDAPLALVIIADSTKSDVWVEDTSIASILIQLQAEKMGLGSCWIQIRNRFHDKVKTSEEYVKEILEIPENYSVESIIAAGYPNESKRPYSDEDLKYNKVHKDKF